MKPEKWRMGEQDYSSSNSETIMDELGIKQKRIYDLKFGQGAEKAYIEL